jgi:hypothetical protein
VAVGANQKRESKGEIPVEWGSTASWGTLNKYKKVKKENDTSDDQEEQRYIQRHFASPRLENLGGNYRDC